MKDLSHLFENLPMSTDRVGACAQLEDELIERGHSISDGPAQSTIWCEPQSGSLHGFWVCGRPDLSIYIGPNHREGDPSTKGIPYWMVEYTLFVCVKHDETNPLRVSHLHEKTAQLLRQLGFAMTEEEVELDGVDGASAHESQWSLRCNSVEHAADLVEALRNIESSQYPDGDQWMGGCHPPSTVQQEETVEPEEPPVRNGCPRVVATGSWYWMAGVSEHSPAHLVGPCAEMAATVYQSGHWVAHRLCGGIKAEGDAQSIKDAMVAAKRAAMKDYGQTSKVRRRRTHQ